MGARSNSKNDEVPFDIWCFFAFVQITQLSVFISLMWIVHFKG
jgi:hypothetical protein